MGNNTDIEVLKKALACCAYGKCGKRCPYFDKKHINMNCQDELCMKALNTIIKLEGLICNISGIDDSEECIILSKQLYNELIEDAINIGEKTGRELERRKYEGRRVATGVYEEDTK